MSVEQIEIPISIDQGKSSTKSTVAMVLKLSRGEVISVLLIALLTYTGLLLRLPERMPLTNSVLTAVVLAAFYFYLRLRLHIHFPLFLILCLIISVVLDIVGNQFGLFSTRVLGIPYDTFTHFLASGMSFIPVMWLIMALLTRSGYYLPLGFVTFFSVTTAFSLGAYYEITELLDDRFFGGHRIWSSRDTTQDLASDLSGVIVAAICYSLVIRKRWKALEKNMKGTSVLDNACISEAKAQD